MKKISTICLGIFLSYAAFAQLNDGSIAPNFTAVDINGQEHQLYDFLEEGKTVILDFSATWCGPCWSYHTGGALHDLMEIYGPEGTDELMVLYIECDATTNMDDLNGLTAASQGDWAGTTNYPIIDESYIGTMYQIGAYPTIMMVCPDRKTQILGQAATQTIYDSAGDCPTGDIIPEVLFTANEYFTCEGQLEVSFYDQSWPRGGNYAWDFGDGNTSTMVNPIHTYAEKGDYTVSLTVSNALGDGIKSFSEFIHVDEGPGSTVHNIGPADNEIGDGRIFEGGHQGLIFDAHQDMVLGSVKVFSDVEAERTVVVLNQEGIPINLKTVMIPEGESRVELELFIPEGEQYILGLYSDAYLYRNSIGAEYPYELDGLVTIVESTAGTTPLNYYYYYYDWEVRSATCSETSANEELLAQSISLYPNPASDLLTIDIENADKITSVNLYTSLGQRMVSKTNVLSNKITMNIESLEPGLYYLSLDDTVVSFVKE